MSNSLATQDRAEIVPAQQPTAMDILQMAVANGSQIDTIERLVALQQKMLERAAETAYNRAMHAAQSEMRRIGADATNPQTRSKYATFVKVDGALRPIYSKHGFSLSFDTEPSGNTDVLRVICYVRHIEGHTSTHRIDMPADGKGAKGNDVMTKTHATGAAFQYGKRYLELGIYNVTVGDTDDDGNGASGSRLGESQILDYADAMNACTDLDELKRVYAPAYKCAQGMNDRDAMQSIRATYERKKGTL